MKQSRGRNVFSLNYLFASFFGALMIASAFAYYNYRFSEYKFIDFGKWVFYEKATIFEPDQAHYTMLIFSSNRNDLETLLPLLSKEHPIIAVDLYQKREAMSDNVHYISASINTLLPMLQRFQIYEVPSAFRLRQEKALVYKQDSPIEAVR